MTDQPREEKAPEGADQPTVEQPTAPAEPAASEQPTVQQPAASAEPASEPSAAQTPSGADQTAVHGQQPPPAPPTPQLSQPGPGQAYGAWGPPPANAPRQPGGFRRFVGHRATQLVGVGLLGLLIGGGVVGGIAIAASHHGPRDGRPGIHRQYDGPHGNQHGPDGRGFGGRGGGNSGNSGSDSGGI